MSNMRFFAVVLAIVPAILMAQSTTTLNLAPGALTPEETDLSQRVQDANGSPVDIIRVLEAHLAKFPESPRRAELEATIYKYAIDLNDTPRIISYGEKVLVNDPNDQIEILDRTLHALLGTDDAESAKRALGLAKQYENAVEEKKARDPEGHMTAAQWANLADRAMARATVLEARALGNAGDAAAALAAAQKSWGINPAAESAQEMGRSLLKLGRNAEAIDWYADAATIDDSAFPWVARDNDRKIAGEQYVKLHGNDQGLGDIFLRAWDRSGEALREHTERYRKMDSNFGQTDAFLFKLPAPNGDTADGAALDMSKLKGKTLVIDFWATWCIPCQAQHPMIESVRHKFAKSPDVVFLSLDSDDDHSLVVPFMKEQKWEQPVYLQGGLGGLMSVTALPTILIIDPTGRVFSRMTGVIPSTFEDVLSSRIQEARAAAAK